MDDNFVLHLVHKHTQEVQEISLPEFISLVASSLKKSGDDILTPRIDDIQVLPILTSKHIILSFRPNAPGTTTLDIDTGGDPIFIEFSKYGLDIVINSSFGNCKESIQYISSNREIMIPLSDKGAESALLETIYDGKRICISVVLQ